jgi:hypothetical protein
MNELETQMQGLRDIALSFKFRLDNACREKELGLDTRGVAKLLNVIVDDMSKEKVNRERLESHAFGIFRIITDGWIFEDTELGQELMDFRLELRKFASKMPSMEEK